MDLVERDECNLDNGDANLLRNLPSKNNALRNGVIASICLCDGKSIKALFNYISSHPTITLNFGPESLKIIETSVDETTKNIDFITHLEFNAIQLEYCFCPQNIGEINDKTCICLVISSETLLSCVSTSKVGTSLRLEYNQRRRTDIAATIISNGVATTKYISTTIAKPQPLYVSGEITADKFEPNCKIVSDLFSLNMTNNSRKVRGVHYGTIIDIFNDGMRIQSKVPKVDPVIFGENNGNCFTFHLDNKTTTRLAKLAKISPKSPVFIDADERVIKFRMPVCAYAKLTIYQYPNSFPPQVSHGTNQISSHSGVSQEDMIKFQQYNAQLSLYFDGLVKAGQTTQILAETAKTSQLQQAWMMILSQTQQRIMNNNTGYQQIRQQNYINEGSAVSQINQIRSTTPLQPINNGSQQIKQVLAPPAPHVPQISVIKFDPSFVLPTTSDEK